MPDDEAILPLDELVRAVEAEDRSAVLALAEETHYADLAKAYQELGSDKHPFFLKTIGPAMAADMIVELPDSMIEEALDVFSPSELRVLFRELSDDDRVDILQDVGDEARLRFLGLLAQAQRMTLLPEIAGLYDQLRAEAEQVVKARVTSAAELAPAELDKIVAALRKRFGRDVEVTTAVDASLIGGAVIDAGDVVIDGSLKGKLERLQNSLAH